MSKGDWRRPRAISNEEWGKRWRAAFEDPTALEEQSGDRIQREETESHSPSEQDGEGNSEGGGQVHGCYDTMEHRQNHLVEAGDRTPREESRQVSRGDHETLTKKLDRVNQEISDEVDKLMEASEVWSREKMGRWHAKIRRLHVRRGMYEAGLRALQSYTADPLPDMYPGLKPRGKRFGSQLQKGPCSRCGSHCGRVVDDEWRCFNCDEP